MGKKDKDEMARQKARFVEGADKNGVKKSDAEYIFELVDKFAGYGFNKSHAAAYALVSYHTAYLKANYREEFLAASMTLDMANTDKLAMFAAEARRSGITVLPPCVNASGVDFGAAPPGKDAPIDQRSGQPRGAIRYSLAALKNIGESAVAAIVEARETGGPFTTLGDFGKRLNPKAFNKRGLETLARSGAFDALEPDRARVAGNVDAIMALAQRTAADSEAGTTDLFAGGSSSGLDLRPAKGWTPMEKLQEEFAGIGFYLSGHPLDEYQALLPKLGVQRFAEFEQRIERGAAAGRLAAIVVSARERRSQKGSKFAFAQFSDATGQFEAIVFSDTLAACRDHLEPGTPVLVSVEAERDGETTKMRVQGIEALDKAVAGLQRGYAIVLDRRAVQAGTALAELKQLLKPGGKGEIRLMVEIDDFPSRGSGRAVEFTMPGRYDLSPHVRGLLTTAPGVLDVRDL